MQDKNGNPIGNASERRSPPLVTGSRAPLRRSPVVLVVDDQEWSTRSLESVLQPNGFALLREFTGAKALARVHLQAPDIAILVKKLPDVDGLTLCAAFRDQLGSRVPLLVALDERPTRAERLAALRAGAWEILVPPIDAEELLLRLEAYVRAKFEGDRILDTGLVDGRTGLYNVIGLERRATELGAWAQREGRPLSCVILGVVLPTADQTTTASAVDVTADVLRKVARNSDILGRIGKSEFAVLAPGTDAAQAVQLAERLAAAVQAGTVPQDGSTSSVRLRGGYDSVSDLRQNPVRGPELITQAALALARAKADGNGEWLRAFRPSPQSAM